MKIDDFGGLCLTNTHLAFKPRDSHVASLLRIIMVTHLHFTYVYITTFTHYHFTTNGNYHNTILPRQERDADE